MLYTNILWNILNITNVWLSNLGESSQYSYKSYKFQDKAYYCAPTSLYKNFKSLQIRDNITLKKFVSVCDSFKGIHMNIYTLFISM